MAGTIISELDFNRIKSQLKTFLQGQAQFADYDYDGSNMSVVLDVLAYNTFQNSFYTNMALGEMFLDSAQLRDSVVSHAKELNYLPRSYRSSNAKVTLTFTPSDNPAFITIPKYTKFTTNVDGKSYTFSTDQVYTITPNSGVYSVSDVSLYEGRIEKEYYDVTASTKYLISNKRVDTDSIVVNVYASSAAGAEVTAYTLKPNLFDVGSSDNVFYIQPAELNRYELEFGNDVFGREPKTGEVVEVIYRISSGATPNGATTFSPTATIQGYTATVTTTTNSSSGAEEETLDSIKFYAPKSIQIQDRAVTESDYENLLKNKFSEIQAVSVQGGEELVPPQYGKVMVHVDIQNSDGVSENAKEKYKKFLKERTPLAIDPVVLSPEFLFVAVDTTVYHNTKISDATEAAIEALVRTSIGSYNTAYLADFKKNVRQSRIARFVDDTADSIVSNDTELRMIIDFIPVVSSASSITADFSNPLRRDHPITAGDDINSHTPAVKTSNFVFETQTAYIQDNSDGILEVITTTVDGFKVLNGDIGTVDYTTGRVVIRDLNVSSFSGSAIKIYGRPETQDIIGPASKIISIRDVDVSVTVEAATQ
jgi:hypothetical protein